MLPERFAPVKYNHPGLLADLGVGLWGWPIPCESAGGGRGDLVLIAATSPSSGTYYFENTGRCDPLTGADIFKPGRRLSDGDNDVTPSYVADGLRVLSPGWEYVDFRQTGMAKRVEFPPGPNAISLPSGDIRGQQWSLVDFDGNGLLDLVIGVGDWADYGWENAFDKNGRWTNGPLHGFVYLCRNIGSAGQPVYAQACRLQAAGRDIDQYGMPSPVFADFRGMGKLDLICGEFIDGLTFYENIGTRQAPVYAQGRRLCCDGEPLTMPLEMIVVTAYDWDHDGRPDLIVAQEDGRVAWLQNTGSLEEVIDRTGQVVARIPRFKPPVFFRQEAEYLRYGALTTPVAVDWNGDGREDLLTGNSAGEIAFIQNLGGTPPKWAEPVPLTAAGKPIRIMAGHNGSIQGPAESKWGYTGVCVGDWDGDGLLDLLVSSSLGQILWYRNVGTRTAPELAAAVPLEVAWPGIPPKPAWNWRDPTAGELWVQWRSTPCVLDVDNDGINDLVTIDHEGYLAFYRQIERNGRRVLLPGERIFRIKGPSTAIFMQDGSPDDAAESERPLRLNERPAGLSGRRTFCFVDWDGDGRLDLLVDSQNVNFLRNISARPGEWLFEDAGPVDGRILAGHNTCPAIVDWNADGIPDLLVGAEDGLFYYLENPRTARE
jgi:hypothetical protein